MRILVVDDNPDLRLLIGQVLSLGGHEVLGAAGGMQALAILEGTSPVPAAVILDVQMPGLDGWETLRAIRQEPATADVPVVMCTVKGTATDAVTGWQLGCDGYVTKPFEIGELLDEVSAVMERTREERAAVRRTRLEAELQRVADHGEAVPPERSGEGAPWTSAR
jgi:DNA-binding response OmpR family regulator